MINYPDWVTGNTSNYHNYFLVWQKFLWGKVCELWNTELKHNPTQLIKEIQSPSDFEVPFITANYYTPDFIKQKCNVDINEINKGFPLPDTTYGQIIEALYRIAYCENEHIRQRIKNRAKALTGRK